MKRYLTKFEQGTQFVNVIRAVTKQDLYQSNKRNTSYQDLDCVKFVPASGAATRLFQALYAYLNHNQDSQYVHRFFDHIESFAFYSELQNNTTSDMTKKELLEVLLEGRMNYGNLPKALLGVHRYKDYVLTPLDEHVYEGLQYLNHDKPRIHFTVSKEHEDLFQQKFETVLKNYPMLELTYSFQKPHTDTPAVDVDNNPFLENDSILYRPGGHGALIENLNDIDADIIFIKNIDNVCHQDDAKDTIYSKQLLASIGLDVKKQIDSHLTKLLHNEYDLEEIATFLEDVLHISYHKELTKEVAIQLLHRPLRVCGVVKNEGEPGGGPFVVDDGEFTSLQICEMSELNHDEYQVLKILKDAEYFNPVDLVCFVRDYQGHRFNLLDFVEESRYFISEKTYKGRALKALEHPGLWNGAMHHWNTVFVEVPITTFNPIKTVLDVLRDGHQPNQ